MSRFEAESYYCPTCRAHFLAPLSWDVSPPYSIRHADDGNEHRHAETLEIYEDAEGADDDLFTSTPP